MPIACFRIKPVSCRVLDIVESFSYIAIAILSIPVIVIGGYYAKSLSGSAYGSSAGLPFAAQAIFYPYLFFGLLFLGVVKTRPRAMHRIIAVCALMILPRAFIALHYGRFFVAEAIVPIALLAVARGWMKLTRKYLCTVDYEGLRGMPATLERILTVNQVGSATDTGAGTGSNYMLELYLSGGIAALAIGSLIFRLHAVS